MGSGGVGLTSEKGSRPWTVTEGGRVRVMAHPMGGGPSRACSSPERALMAPRVRSILTTGIGHPARKDLPMAHRIVGQPIARLDGLEKVSGRTRYSADVALPGLV